MSTITDDQESDLHVSHQLFCRLVAGDKDHFKWLSSSYKLLRFVQFNQRSEGYLKGNQLLLTL